MDGATDAKTAAGPALSAEGDFQPPKEEEGREEAKPARRQPTRQERQFYNVLAAPLNRFHAAHEPNVLEHHPARFLALLPHPFPMMVRLGLESLAGSLHEPLEKFAPPSTRTEAEKTPNDRKAAKADVAQPGDSKNDLTRAISRSFDAAAALTAKKALQVCGGDRKVKRIIHLLPDTLLQGNVYDSAVFPAGMEPAAGSFLVITSQYGCLYQPEMAPNELSAGPDDIYGCPTDMFNVQTVQSQAPKRWLIMRTSKMKEEGAGEVLVHGHLTAVSDKRLLLARDREVDAAAGASIFLRVDKAKKRRTN